MMRTTIWTGICTAALSVAAAAAIAQPPQPPQTSTSDHRITVTGCLRDATADSSTTSGTVGTTGTTGSSGAAASAVTGGDPRFVLTNAATASATTTTPPASSTDARADQSPSSQAYRLIANPTALSPHAGKKLELTGVVEDSPSVASTSSDAVSPFANAAKLRVESGKIVAASCDK
jgi:hypothetical protein